VEAISRLPWRIPGVRPCRSLPPCRASRVAFRKPYHPRAGMSNAKTASDWETTVLSAILTISSAIFPDIRKISWAKSCEAVTRYYIKVCPRMVNVSTPTPWSGKVDDKKEYDTMNYDGVADRSPRQEFDLW